MQDNTNILDVDMSQHDPDIDIDHVKKHHKNNPSVVKFQKTPNVKKRKAPKFQHHQHTRFEHKPDFGVE